VIDGIRGGDAGGEPESPVVVPPEGGEGEVFPGDGSADVDRDAGEGREFLVAKEIADAASGRLVQDQPEGALSGGVFGDQDHGPVEDAVSQGGICDQKLALEANRGFLGGDLTHEVILACAGSGVKKGEAWGKAEEARCGCRLPVVGCRLPEDWGFRVRFAGGGKAGGWG